MWQCTAPVVAQAQLYNPPLGRDTRPKLTWHFEGQQTPPAAMPGQHHVCLPHYVMAKYLRWTVSVTALQPQPVLTVQLLLEFRMCLRQLKRLQARLLLLKFRMHLHQLKHQLPNTTDAALHAAVCSPPTKQLYCRKSVHQCRC